MKEKENINARVGRYMCNYLENTISQYGEIDYDIYIKNIRDKEVLENGRKDKRRKKRSKCK